MKNLTPTVFFTFFIMFSACGNSTKQPVTEIVNNVELVHNFEQPLYPEKTVTFEEEVTFGEENESGEVHLYMPGRYTVGGNGSVYISDRGDRAIKEYDSSGKYVRTIGKEGQGPGEFQGIADLQILPDGRLIVLDFKSNRLSIFNPEGKFLTSSNLPHSMFTIYLTTDSTFTSDETVYRPEKKHSIKTFDFSGIELMSFGDFVTVKPKILRSKGMAFALGIPYIPLSVFAGDNKNQLLFHCLNSEYLIEVYDKNGVLFRKIYRPYTPLPFTGKDREEFIKNVSKNPNKVFVEMAKEAELPRIKTVTNIMIMDTYGKLWVSTNETKTENGRTLYSYDIFSEKGYYDTRIWSPVGVGIFRDGKMYSHYTDEETGITTIKRYKVIWN